MEADGLYIDMHMRMHMYTCIHRCVMEELAALLGAAGGAHVPDSTRRQVVLSGPNPEH